MTPSINAFNLVKKFEGKEYEVYLDPAGIPSAGYGHTEDLTHDDVGKSVDDATIDQWLLNDMQTRAADPVNSLILIELNQNQFDALCSFVFNIGAGTFEGSTLRMAVNTCSFDLAAQEFHKWVHADVHGVETVLPGLVARREAEFDLFTTPIAEE